MTVKNNQLESPFLLTDKQKLDAIEPGAEANPAIATNGEAIAGTDNVKMMTAVRVKEAIDASIIASGTAIIESFTSNHGAPLTAMILVKQDTDSNISGVDLTSESDVANILGVLLDSINDGESGDVALSGLVQNVTTSFEVGDVIYLSVDGDFTSDVPDIGVDDFEEGDFVVKIGRVIKNVSNPIQKDFLLEIQVIGQL